MSAVSSPRMLSQHPLELVIQQLARLFQADAIGMLAVAPASIFQTQKFAIIGNAGFAPSALAQLNCQRLFVGTPPASSARLLPADMVERLTGSPLGICLASPVFDGKSRDLTGAGLLRFPPLHFDAERAHVAAALLTDLTAHEIERRKENQHLKDALALAKALSARHTKSSEQAQKNLATEIHDDLSQNVTCIRLGLSAIERQLDGGNVVRARHQIRELAKTSLEISNSIQKMSCALRPSLIDSLGPLPAIRGEAALHAKRTGNVVECELADVALPGQVSLAMVRIVQAALANALTHAQASKISIRLTVEPGTIILSIRDDGRGFDTQMYRHSLGLLAMIERAEIAGGSLALYSHPGDGTSVVATFPRKVTAGTEGA